MSTIKSWFVAAILAMGMIFGVATSDVPGWMPTGTIQTTDGSYGECGIEGCYQGH